MAPVRPDEASLLWRVRRKLILSYIFIGVVPSLLIIVFFLFCSAVLFMGVAAYLFKSGYDKVVDDVKVVAQAAALEISRNPSTAAQTIERVHRIRSRQYPALSVVYVAADGTSYSAGPLGALDCADVSARMAEGRPLCGYARAAASGSARPG